MKKLQGFSPTFWVANVIELFERFAYYGSKAILAVFVADQVGMGPEKAGWLVGSLFNGLLYFLPILAGTIVDRFGFKKSLLACFSIFCVGYLLIGLGGLPQGKPLVDALGAEGYMILALVVTARWLADQAASSARSRARQPRDEGARLLDLLHA
jgi:dipeptide/tripeptide permease